MEIEATQDTLCTLKTSAYSSVFHFYVSGLDNLRGGLRSNQKIDVWNEMKY